MAGGLGALLIGTNDGGFDVINPRESGIAIPGDARSLTSSDLDGDGNLDLVVGLNHSMVQTFTHRKVEDGALLTVRIAKPESGVRITCRLSDDSSQVAEWQAGGGYLSQNPPLVSFGIKKGTTVSGLSVRWPDGTTTEHKVAAGATTLTVSQ